MLKSILLGLAATAIATPLLEARSQCGEGPKRVCYGVDGGESQDLNTDDIQYVADYLRYLDEQNSGAAKFWTMPKETKIGECAEWTLPIDDGASVLALAKHISPRTTSSVLFLDLADAIDGGLNATPDQKKAALAGCGTHGGQYGVTANTSNPLYSSDDYKKLGAKPEGIIIKLVKAPPKIMA